MDTPVIMAIEENVAIVTLNRPTRHNGMDFPMLDGILVAQRQLRRNRSIRAVILRGEGPSFCAGMDFKTAMSQPAKAAIKALQLLWPWTNHFQRWSMGWRRVGVPVIAALHGNCFGAGLQLALGADIRFCHPDSKLSLMEAKWGLVPDMGGICLLRELVPIDVAKELTLTGRIIGAQEAYSLGLVTHLSEDPLADSRSLAAEIATRSPDSVAAGKFLLQQAWRAGDYAALRAERLWQRRVIGRANQRLAVARQTVKSTAPSEAPKSPEFKPRNF